MNPEDKRLAMPTEDHPLEYGDFEGVIPMGQYGGGPVIVWDTGTYTNLSERDGQPLSVEEAIEYGRVKFRLNGKKLHGAFALTRMSAKPVRWLLIKMKDAEAKTRGDITKTEPDSVISGRSIAEVLKTV